LQLHQFWKNKAKKEAMKYDPEIIFRLLIFSRVLFPGSKKYTYDNRDIYFEKFDGFSLDDVYHNLTFIDKYQQEMQKWIFERSTNICNRDLSVSYFDCTNYYFDIGRPDMDTLDDDGIL